MSIKTIDQDFVSSGSGVDKKINAGAQKMIYDVLQASQYSTPIPSTVRELAANAWDAQREKEIAIEILSGQKQASDYYITRSGEQYEDSNFDSSYYSLPHLDTESNEVLLRYTQNSGGGFCDLFEVIDKGVGLGDKRLEGILSLGFSSKRNSSEGFGAFGLGAKAAFSTGVPAYNMRTVHNGRLFLCTCYPYKSMFTVPRMNLITGQENKFIVFSDGLKVYYEETDETNGTVISFGVKRHNRNLFTEAVRDQLLYVNNIYYEIVDNEFGSSKTRTKTAEKVIYSSNSLILSEREVFTKPHIVIVKSPKDPAGINYGLIDFKELELEELHGSVGFKCPIKQSYRDENGVEIVIQEGVSVTPSREKVIWDDATKQYVLGVIKAAEIEATQIVTDELSGSTEFIPWIKACSAIFSSHRMRSNTTLGRLSAIVESSSISPRFPLNPDIMYKDISTVFGALQFEKVTVNYKGVISIVEVNSLLEFGSFNNIYIKDGNYSKSKNMYLCKELKLDSIICVKDVSMSDEWIAQIKVAYPESSAFIISNRVGVARAAMQYLIADPSVKKYADVVVPDHIEEAFKEAENQKGDTLSPAYLRFLEGKEVAFTMRQEYKSRSYEWVADKIEPKMDELINPSHPLYYYTSDEKDEMQGFLSLMQIGFSKYTSRYAYQDGLAFYSLSLPVSMRNSDVSLKRNSRVDLPEISVVQLSESLLKKVLSNAGNISHFSELLYNRVGSKISIHPALKYAFTLVLCKEIFKDCPSIDYMDRFSNVDSVIYDKYVKYEKYREKVDSLNLFNRGHYANKLVEKLRSLYDFQLFCESNPSKEELMQESFQRFIFTDITGADVIDVEYLELAKELYDYNVGVGELLARVERSAFNNQDSISEILGYLRYKNRDGWKWGIEEAEEISSEMEIEESVFN